MSLGKVVLITPYPDITSFGLRTMSAYLRRKGHHSRLIFAPIPQGDDSHKGARPYEDTALDELTGLCRDADLVGITLMTNFFDGVVQITEKIKSAGVKAPVIWGGVHPTVRPEESLAHADIVCVGDGEEALLELVTRMESGQEYTSTENLWFKTPRGIVKNPVRPLVRDLDVYPIPDYSREDHHVLADGHFVPLTESLTKRFMAYPDLGRIGYQTMTGRGCPHQCTYCINDALKNIYAGKGYLRWRSTEHVMRELLWVKEHMPYVNYIGISDDAFFARSVESIREFCQAYQEKVNIPFSCLTSPMTLTEEKLGLLVDTGLIFLQMGIQTGSARIQELFNRKNMTNERVLKATRIINKFKDRIMPPMYDFILDVPYETPQDVWDSFKLIAEIPKPYRVQPFALVLYPGTKLHDMAAKDGLLSDERKQIYSKIFSMRQANYVNLLMALVKGGKFPGPLLKLLVTPPLATVFNSGLMRPFFKLLYLSLKLLKKLKGRAQHAPQPT